MQPVEVQASYHRLLGVVGRLLIDDACQGRHLFASQMQGFRLGFSLSSPEAVVLAFHTLHELIDRGVPIDLVGIGNEEGRNGCRRIAVSVQVRTVSQRRSNLSRIHHQALRQGGCKPLHRAGGRYDELYRLLNAVPQLPVEMQAR